MIFPSSCGVPQIRVVNMHGNFADAASALVLGCHLMMNNLFPRFSGLIPHRTLMIGLLYFPLRHHKVPNIGSQIYPRCPILCARLLIICCSRYTPTTSPFLSPLSRMKQVYRTGSVDFADGIKLGAHAIFYEARWLRC